MATDLGTAGRGCDMLSRQSTRRIGTTPLVGLNTGTQALHVMSVLYRDCSGLPLAEGYESPHDVQPESSSLYNRISRLLAYQAISSEDNESEMAGRQSIKSRASLAFSSERIQHRSHRPKSFPHYLVLSSHQWSPLISRDLSSVEPSLHHGYPQASSHYPSRRRGRRPC